MSDVDVSIDPEFRGLIAPLTAEERRQLEDNLIAEGARDSLVTWRGLLLDGHHRYEICRRLGIAFRVAEVELPDRDAALVWIIHNQLGRRNLTPFARAELALKLQPSIAAKARAKQLAGLKQNVGTVPQNSAERASFETRAEVAKAAGVSHDTLDKAKLIVEHGSEAEKEDLRRDKVSINRVHAEIRRNLEKEESARRKEAWLAARREDDQDDQDDEDEDVGPPPPARLSPYQLKDTFLYDIERGLRSSLGSSLEYHAKEIVKESRLVLSKAERRGCEPGDRTVLGLVARVVPLLEALLEVPNPDKWSLCDVCQGQTDPAPRKDDPSRGLCPNCEGRGYLIEPPDRD